MLRSYIFPTIVMVTALSLAAGAALFTVLGFRELFEPSLKITYMAATIEFGKIVAVSALYQLREILGWVWKSILFFMILTAMAVTSMGVYGYLAGSHQKDSLDIDQNEAQLELLEQRENNLENRLENIDEQIAEVPETYVTKRMELIEKFKPERQSILTELDNLNEKKNNLTIERINKETEFGPVILLAESVEWLDSNKAMLYFILAVILIFDPLAIALTYSANVSYANVAKRKKEELEKPEFSTDSEELKEQLTDHINNIFNNKEKENDQDQLNEALSSLGDAINNISSEIDELKNKKVVNPRADVVDSMRQQKNS